MEQDHRRTSSQSTETLNPFDARPGRAVEDSSFTLLRSNVTEAIRILLLRRWAFFIPFCLVFTVALIGTHWIPRSFQSTTVIERRDHTVLMNLRQTAATGGFANFFRPTLLRDLTSIEAMTEVVKNAGLAEPLERDPAGNLTPAAERACARRAVGLAGGVSARLISRDEHFDQIQILCTASKAQLPRQLCEEVKNTYIRRTRAKLTAMLNEGREYFEHAASTQRDRIAELEEDLLTFQAQYIGVDPTNPAAIKLKLTSLESERSELLREVSTLGREVDARERMVTLYRQRAADRKARTTRTSPMPAIPQTEEGKRLETRIRELQGQIHDLQMTRGMTERHPDIVELRRQISHFRERFKAQIINDVQAVPANQGLTLDERFADAAVEAAVGWDMELAGLQMDLRDRIGRLDGSQSRLRIVEEDIRKHEQLQSNIFQHRKAFQLQTDQLEQTRIEYRANTAKAIEISSILDADESQMGMSFTELTPPTAASRPVKPRGVTAVVLCLLAGLAAGAIVVLFCELFDQTYHTTKQVTRSLGVAILETVDEIVTSADRARLFRRRVIYRPALVTVLLAMVGGTCAAAYLSLERPHTYDRLMAVPRQVIQEWRDRTTTGFSTASGDRNARPLPGAGDHQQAAAPIEAPTPAIDPRALPGDLASAARSTD